MTEPMMYRVRSRLSQQALNGRGVNVGAALRRAEAVFQTLSAPCLLEIDLCLAEMDAAFGPDTRHRNDADLEALYLLSSRVIDVSHCLPTSGWIRPPGPSAAWWTPASGAASRIGRRSICTSKPSPP